MRSTLLASCLCALAIWHVAAQNPGPRFTPSATCMEVHRKILDKIRNGQLAEAEAALSGALTSKEVGGDLSCLWVTLDNMATVIGFSGRFAEAEVLAERSLSIMDRFYPLDDPARFRPLHLLWSVQIQQGKRGKAQRTFRSMQSVRLDEPQDQARLYSATAAHWQAEGQPKEAEMAYSKALSAWTELGLGETADAAAMLVGLGAVQLSQGRYLEAGKALDRALSIVQSAKDAVPLDLINVRVTRAGLYARQGKWQAASEDLGAVISLADRDARLDSAQRKLILANLAHFLRKAHRAKEARSIEARAATIHAPESTRVVDVSELVDNGNARRK